MGPLVKLLPSVYVAKGAQYPIVGQISEDGENLYLVQIPLLATIIRIAIKEDGSLSDIILGRFDEKLIGMDIVPSNTLFKVMNDTGIDTKAGYTNFEMIFTGVTDQSVNVLYREYSAKDITKPSVQDLTYPRDAKIIRFREIKLAVKQVTNEKITYTVLEDGLKNRLRN